MSPSKNVTAVSTRKAHKNGQGRPVRSKKKTGLKALDSILKFDWKEELKKRLLAVDSDFVGKL